MKIPNKGNQVRPGRIIQEEEAIVEGLRSRQDLSYVELSKKFKVSLRVIRHLVFKHDISRVKGAKRVLDTALKHVFARYKRQARERKFSFDLTQDQFQVLISSPCEYCSDIESNLLRQHDVEWLYNGIDRVDSSLGYSSENCVPCCKHCNRMKLDMTLSDFSKRVLRLAEYFAASENKIVLKTA